MKRRTRLWLRFILILMLTGGVYLLLRNYEQELYYTPSAFVKRTPREAGMAFDNIALVTDDGVNIQGWFVPAQPPEQAPATNSTTPTLLFFHGRTGNLGDCLEKIHFFHDMGLDVFGIDYHGYGKSGGAPSERALTSDALTAYFYLTEKRGVKPEQIYIYGEDLGAAVGIDLAARVTAAGLITEGANASIIEQIEDDWPLIPWQYLLRNQFDSLTRIRDVHIPVLIIHSAEDELVPFNSSRRLCALAHEPKELVEIHGTHGGAYIKSFDVYYDKIERFVRGQSTDKSADSISSTQTNAPASKEPTP
jgi:alpha-beta hydrolase superfamily lysophospholipase